MTLSYSYQRAHAAKASGRTSPGPLRWPEDPGDFPSSELGQRSGCPDFSEQREESAWEDWQMLETGADRCPPRE